jgi:hypothetical protein
MELPLLIKIRLAVIFGGAIVLFGLLSSRWGCPDNVAGVVTLLRSGHPILLFFWLLVLSTIITLFALSVSGRWAYALGPLAVPAGLCVWSITTAGFDRLLLENIDIAQRSGVFYQFAGEIFLWLIPVAWGYFITIFVSRRKSPALPTPQPRQTSRQTALPSAADDIRRHLTGFKWQSDILAIVLTCAIALILMHLLVRAGQVQFLFGGRDCVAATTPMIGQIVFGVVAAFMLATLAVKQLLNAGIWCFLCAPAIVAVISYLAAAQSSSLEPLSGMAWPFVLAKTLNATILPVQYIGLGCLAVIWGYWASVNTTLARQQRLSEQA